MTEQEKDKHNKTKKTLRIVGIIVLVVGAILTIIGLADFFTSIGGKDAPKLFGLAFAGIPFLAIGAFITIFSFNKEISNYVKDEVTSIINDYGEDIKPAVTSMSNATKEGLEDSLVCPKCGEKNESNSKFCKKCGESLTKTCPKCGATLDGDSNFCNNCGEKLD